MEFNNLFQMDFVRPVLKFKNRLRFEIFETETKFQTIFFNILFLSDFNPNLFLSKDLNHRISNVVL